jgi:CheY-like chemotaxis protein
MVNTHVDSSEDALIATNQLHPNLILMDIDINGKLKELEVCKEIVPLDVTLWKKCV